MRRLRSRQNGKQQASFSIPAGIGSSRRHADAMRVARLQGPWANMPWQDVSVVGAVKALEVRIAWMRLHSLQRGLRAMIVCGSVHLRGQVTNTRPKRAHVQLVPSAAMLFLLSDIELHAGPGREVEQNQWELLEITG